MKQMTEQLGMYFHMYKTILGEKVGDERGDIAVGWILGVLATIAIVGIVVAAVTLYVQNRTAELGA
ncbi:hypothetical protein ACIA8I_41420 [Streptomyces rishiriensis]|uniref:hypothetical protein n=1 Tax=Streptomyces rishiriensis TaxID=68264 RepID=UPI00379705F8